MGADKAATNVGYAAVTIGTFDGVHLGHRHLIGATRHEAAGAGLRVVVVTFDRHPLATIRPEAAPRLLTTLDQKVELLYAAGADDVVVLVFDAARAGQSAEDFVSTFLVEELGARIVVVGEGFHFGHRQHGNVELLESMGRSLGYRVATVPLVAIDAANGIISSSLIRELIAQGDLESAAKMLGRQHEVRGTLTDAETPTVAVPFQLIVPPPGAYAVEVDVAGGFAKGVGRLLDTPAGQPSMIELAIDSAEPPRAPSLVAGEHAAVRFAARLSLAAGEHEKQAPSVEQLG
jgi:riboflavin kinase / FMN adenylyltransferase